MRVVRVWKTGMAAELIRGAYRNMSEPISSAGCMTEYETLVSSARLGDRDAFGLLYQRFAPMVHGILLARVTPADAEDLVHEVFLTAMSKLPSLREDAAFPGWLAAIARNRACDHHRRGVEAAEAPEDLACNTGAGNEVAMAALAAIRALPQAYRETLILRFVEGMTGQEIAERTGLTPASVRVNLHRGVKRLRKILGKEERL